MSDPLRTTLHRRLLDAPFDPTELGRAELRARLAAMLREEAPLLASATAETVLDELVDDVGGLGPLEPLLADATITEIMINGPDRVFIERAGRIEPVECSLDAATIVRIVERVIAPLGLRLDRASPMVDARLPDGARLHAVLPPLAPDGPCVTIRRFGGGAVPLAAFGLDAPAHAFCEAIVRGGWNIVVSGATSSGKTTCCNALARAIEPTDRIVTIEETAELRLRQPHVVRLEARRANAEGAGEVSVRELVRAALRMRPDRLVVGEVRGGEALDMLQACNTGHDGSLSTVHANSPDDTITRLETLTLLSGVALPLAAVRAQLASAVDAIVQVTRGTSGRREVVAVAEIVPGRTPRPARCSCEPGASCGPSRLRRVFRAGVPTTSSKGGARAHAGRSGYGNRRGGDVPPCGPALRRYATGCTHGSTARHVRCRVGSTSALPVRSMMQSSISASATRCRSGVRQWAAPRSSVSRSAGTRAHSDSHCWSERACLRSCSVCSPGAHDRGGRRARDRHGRLRTARRRHDRDRHRQYGTPRRASRHRLRAHRHARASRCSAGRRARCLGAWNATHPESTSRAGALAMCTTVGGRAADALEGLATSLRDRRAIVAEARALSAQARMSALVVGGMPVLYLGWSGLTGSGAFHALTGTTAGRACIAGGIVFESLGIWWMHRILRSGSIL